MFAVVVVLSFFIFRPYLNILVLAATFAIITFPMYQKINRALGSKIPGISSFLSIVVVVIIVGTPITILGMQVFQEATNVYERIQGNVLEEQGILGDVKPASNPIIRKLQERFEGFVTYVSADLDTYAENVLQWFLTHLGPFFQGAAQIVLGIFLWFLSLYYFLKEGHRIKSLFVTFSPLSDRYDTEIVARIVNSVKSVVGGSLIIALLQGTLAGIGFAIFGVPLPAIWGLVAVIAALVPTVGTALITLPAAAYLFLVSSPFMAGGMLIWGIVIVGGIDNIIRPKLLERGIHIHPLTILLSVLGGIAFFGPIGFLTGPIIVSLLAEFLKIYQSLVVRRVES